MTKELPADGESVSFELTSGDYVVGVHIPEGNYQADVSYDYDGLEVDDWDSGFYLYEYAGRTDGDYLDDLRLYNGAIVHISSQTTITLYSDNAQTENILYENNPLAGQEPLVVKKDLTVGCLTFRQGCMISYWSVEKAVWTLIFIQNMVNLWRQKICIWARIAQTERNIRILFFRKMRRLH